MAKRKTPTRRPWMVRQIDEKLRRQFVGLCKMRGTTANHEIEKFMLSFISTSDHAPI